jgi:hypothetical protein
MTVEAHKNALHDAAVTAVNDQFESARMAAELEGSKHAAEGQLASVEDQAKRSQIVQGKLQDLCRALQKQHRQVRCSS